MPRDRLSTAANVATIVAVVTALAILGSRYWTRRFQKESVAPQRIVLQRTATSPAERTVLLVLSSNCRFCTESADLYRRIVEMRRKGTSIIAWMAEPASDARAYLNRLGVVVDEVISARPEDVHAQYTPTIIVVDAAGNVDSWFVGKLTPVQEAKLLASLSPCDSCIRGRPANESSIPVPPSPEPPEHAGQMRRQNRRH